MAPCSPNDVSVNLPSGPSGPAIPGFGVPFALNVPSINPFPDGFPEDLLDLFNQLQLLIPPGALKPQLNPNFGKDVFDAIMKLLDQFMPFLMLYKFFLPILELIICIIEVLCALMNPFKLIRALKRLFTQCIPDFLNMFPIFALICMIISLLLLILALIEYIIEQIIKFVNIILRNILALEKAFQDADQQSVLAITRKLGSVLCIFQNLFVLLAIFNIIIEIIKDILSLIFHIPPCEDSNPSDQDGCCTPDVCPAIVKTNYTNSTGIFKYLPQVAVTTSLTLPAAFGGTFNFAVRPESWQFYDLDQAQAQQFRNIFDGYDVVILPKPTFFPTDAVYTATTDPKQAPYAIDMRLYYNPASWGRTGTARFIRFNNCLLSNVPTTNLVEGDLTTETVFNGVAVLVGGAGFEDDNSTILTGFATDGVTPISTQANIENFIHMPTQLSNDPILHVTDGYTFTDVTYTFKPNISPLLQKNLVTLGCVPDFAVSRAFINNIFAGDIGVKLALLGDLLNGRNGNVFPDSTGTQACLTNALTNLRTNMTVEGVAQFQAATTVCLNKYKNDTNSALGAMVGIGFEPCNSTFSLSVPVQFTTKTITVTVDLNERNGFSLTKGLSEPVSTNIAARINAHTTFGEITNFSYDGYQSFLAELSSVEAGSGSIMISFDNNTFCTNTFPSDVTNPPVHSLQAQNYQFVFAPTFKSPVTETGAGDTEGVKPRRDEGDASREGGDGGGTE